MKKQLRARRLWTWCNSKLVKRFLELLNTHLRFYAPPIPGNPEFNLSKTDTRYKQPPVTLDVMRNRFSVILSLLGSRDPIDIIKIYSSIEHSRPPLRGWPQGGHTASRLACHFWWQPGCRQAGNRRKTTGGGSPHIFIMLIATMGWLPSAATLLTWMFDADRAVVLRVFVVQKCLNHRLHWWMDFTDFMCNRSNDNPVWLSSRILWKIVLARLLAILASWREVIIQDTTIGFWL